MAKFKRVEFKMAAIIKLNENERLKFFFLAKWMNPTWQNLSWLPLSSWVRENEWSFFLCKWWEPILASVSDFERKYYHGWIQHSQIQDGRIWDSCHHQVRWEWMSLSQIELVWVRVRVEWVCFWVNLRKDKKGSESKMAVSESNMAEFKIAAIIKLSQNEWVKFFVQSVGTNLGKYEWVWEEILRWLNPRWQNPRWQNSRLLPSSWVRMNEWNFFVQMVATNLGKCEWLWEEILTWLNPT